MTNIPVEDRHRWIGSSESAVLLGVSPFATLFEVWHIKAGNLPSPDLDADERVRAGQFLEPAIAKWAADKWSWPLLKVSTYLEHATVPRMGASLDFETADGEPVEIKNVDSLVFKDHWAADGDTITDAPVHYLVQVQHQLACRPEQPRGWLVACIGGNRLMRMEVKRHPGIIRRIEGTVDEFWSTVEAGDEPRPDFQADADAIAALYAQATDEFADLRGDNHLPVLCSTYLESRRQAKAFGAQADAARAEILTIIGGARKALCKGFSLSAGTVAATDVAFTRKAYRNLRITENQELVA